METVAFPVTQQDSVGGGRGRNSAALTLGKSWQALTYAVLQAASMSQLLQEGVAPQQRKSVTECTCTSGLCALWWEGSSVPPPYCRDRELRDALFPPPGWGPSFPRPAAGSKRGGQQPWRDAAPRRPLEPLLGSRRPLLRAAAAPWRESEKHRPGEGGGRPTARGAVRDFVTGGDMPGARG